MVHYSHLLGGGGGGAGAGCGGGALGVFAFSKLSESSLPAMSFTRLRGWWTLGRRLCRRLWLCRILSHCPKSRCVLLSHLLGFGGGGGGVGCVGGAFGCVEVPGFGRLLSFILTSHIVARVSTSSACEGGAFGCAEHGAVSSPGKQTPKAILSSLMFPFRAYLPTWRSARISKLIATATENVKGTDVLFCG